MLLLALCLGAEKHEPVRGVHLVWKLRVTIIQTIFGKTVEVLRGGERMNERETLIFCPRPSPETSDWLFSWGMSRRGKQGQESGTLSVVFS